MKIYLDDRMGVSVIHLIPENQAEIHQVKYVLEQALKAKCASACFGVTDFERGIALRIKPDISTT